MAHMNLAGRIGEHFQQIIFRPPRIFGNLEKFFFCNFAAKGGGFSPSRRAVMDQYSSGTKAWMARSLSQMMRTATDWTRPALSPYLTFFHKIGEIW
jgi:hypothetical protein